MRGATKTYYRYGRRPQFQPTRPLRGATDITADEVVSKQFQPTRPLRGATITWMGNLLDFYISTHAPLAGRDPCTKVLCFYPYYFNPRAPCGARPIGLAPLICFLYFNPRAPCGARQQKCTNHYAHFCDNRQISDAFAQNAACQSILLLFDAGKPCGFGCEPPK